VNFKTTWLRFFVLVQILLWSSSIAFSCLVPVFQYALESWPNTPYSIYIFNKGPSLPEAQFILKSFHDQMAFETPPVFLNEVDLSGKVDPEYNEIWAPHQNQQTPWVVVKDGYKEKFWSGPLIKEEIEALTDSPLRREIVKRIANGDSGVWLLLESGNVEKDNNAEKILNAQIAEFKSGLPKELPPQEQVAPPPGDGSVVFKTAFSTIRVKREDPAERFFMKMLFGIEPAVLGSKGPLLFLIYGRGRGIFVTGLEEINKTEISNALYIITGDCSCIIKASKPGKELLFCVDWKQIVGELTSKAFVAAMASQQPIAPPDSMKLASINNPETPSKLKRNVVLISCGLVLSTFLAGLFLKLKK
jgi:hypothetical protein